MGTREDSAGRCSYQKAKGGRCRNRAAEGSDRCHRHPHRMGRPTKLSAEVQDKIVSYVRRGNYLETAAAAAGIHKRTLFDWLKRGTTGEAPYADFLHAVDEANAEAEARDLETVSEHAHSDWRAAAWKLERRRGARWQPGGEQDVAPGSLLAGLQSDDRAAQAQAMVTVYVQMALEARAKGEHATARALMDSASRVLGLFPSDQAAMERAGIGGSVAKINEQTEERLGVMTEQLEQHLATRAPAERDVPPEARS